MYEYCLRVPEEAKHAVTTSTKTKEQPSVNTLEKLVNGLLATMNALQLVSVPNSESIQTTDSTHKWIYVNRNGYTSAVNSRDAKVR